MHCDTKWFKEDFSTKWYPFEAPSVYAYVIFRTGIPCALRMHFTFSFFFYFCCLLVLLPFSKIFFIGSFTAFERHVSGFRFRDSTVLMFLLMWDSCFLILSILLIWFCCLNLPFFLILSETKSFCKRFIKTLLLYQLFVPTLISLRFQIKALSLSWIRQLRRKVVSVSLQFLRLQDSVKQIWGEMLLLLWHNHKLSQ